MKYARIENGWIQEVIEPFFKTEDMRPPRPADLSDDATELQQQAYLEALAAHDSFIVGEVPIAERFSEEIVAQLVEVPEGVTVEQGYLFDGSTFSAPAPYVAPALTAEQARAQRDAELTAAALYIEPLQDAVDLGDATPAEEAALLAWKQYRVKLRRLEEQAGFPSDIAWPAVPPT